jgi:hypothetical protein
MATRTAPDAVGEVFRAITPCTALNNISLRPGSIPSSPFPRNPALSPATWRLALARSAVTMLAEMVLMSSRAYNALCRPRQLCSWSDTLFTQHRTLTE